MNICVLGAGYVGLTTTAVLAELGHDVICVDKDQDKIKQLRQNQVPIYEPGLAELIKNNSNRITFCTDSQKGIVKSDAIFIAVGTPSDQDGKPDLTYVLSVIEDFSTAILSYKTIITKSTVPPGTNELIEQLLMKKGVKREDFDIVSNPEFLREGSAVFDMFHADKTVIGLKKNDVRSLPIMREIYNGLEAPFIVTSLTGAELIKYANNAFLATKISFINEISRICDAYGVDITEISKGIGADPRIGSQFLQAGLGYGGSCFPKDLQALYYAAVSKNVTAQILQAVQKVNETQIDLYMKKLHAVLPDLRDKKVSVLGISFKPNTDDTRYSRAVALIEKLVNQDCRLFAYDPKARIPEHILEKATQAESLEESIEQADCLILATEWDDFIQLDWQYVKEKMKGNIIVDGRNCLEPEKMKALGFQYIGVGRG
ncbi:UDP-glucose/GDP-mannose dehydrogenase family protein [Bacillus methanolicus]|uniref:UDP-glucose dehydrogenase family protein n=1 Tax=Bacillus methanolicus TaxID=1471 RepID=UPI00237FF322|nr:UDP-glucose/GDP-mannose dehydrogenase family protein [Bacillus methanolicus]MDE3838279.1 UDP-glucose/GDP-mannose dehydrogenase family protein [Bacillus methanolicus]